MDDELGACEHPGEPDEDREEDPKFCRIGAGSEYPRDRVLEREDQGLGEHRGGGRDAERLEQRAPRPIKAAGAEILADYRPDRTRTEAQAAPAIPMSNLKIRIGSKTALIRPPDWIAIMASRAAPTAHNAPP